MLERGKESQNYILLQVIWEDFAGFQRKGLVVLIMIVLLEGVQGVFAWLLQNWIKDLLQPANLRSVMLLKIMKCHAVVLIINVSCINKQEHNT